MPGYRGHLVGGALAFGALYVCLRTVGAPVVMTGPCFLAALAGALFPDVDVKSKGQKYLYWLLLIIFIILIIENKLDILALFALLSIVPMIVNHRGLFHRPWFIIFSSLGLWIIVSAFHPEWARELFCIVLFFIAGGISHLWLDFGFFRMIRLFFVFTFFLDQV